MSVKVFAANEAVHEKSDCQYTCTFSESSSGQPTLASSAITAITATLTDVVTGTTINSRSAQSVLDVNGGSLTAAGVFTLQLASADNVIQTANEVDIFEQHRLTLRVTFTRTGGGTGTLNHEIHFFVRNLVDVN